MMFFVFPSNCDIWGDHALLEKAEHLPDLGKESFNFLFCFAWMYDFWFLLENVFIKIYEFSGFCSSYYLPSSTGGEVKDWLCGT